MREERAALRVTFVVPDLGVGGAERHVATLLGQMDRRIVSPRVVCLGREGELFADAARWAPATAYGHSKRQLALSVLRLARELRRTRTDVVVLRGYNAELIGRVAAILARTPHRIVWVHNCGDDEPRGRVRSISDRLLESATDAYFGVAYRQVPYLTEDLGHPASKVRIVHNGVDPALFSHPDDVAARDAFRAELGLAPEHVVTGILAALRPEKDHELFLRAAAGVAALLPEARFVVAGDGERRPVLESLAADLGIADRVIFTGFRSDVPRLLQALDVFVLASYTIECFPMSLLEAMASGRAAVCTDVGGVGEIIDEGVTGHLVPPRNEVALTGRLLEVLGDDERRAAQGAAGRDRVERLFTLERSVKEAERALLEVAGRTSTPEPWDGVVSARPVRLTVVMDETAIGGAELVTLRMFQALDRSIVEPRLVCMRDEGPLAGDFRAAGVPVEVLHRTGWSDARTLPRLVRTLRRHRTDAVLLSHHHRAALVLGRVAALLAGVRVTVLAAHDMDLVPLGGRVFPTHVVQTLRGVSALVLLAPSQGEYLHRFEGVGNRPWNRTREVVIPNGIPLPPAPTSADRVTARALLELPPQAFVVGIVARLSEQKAHHVLLLAFAELLPRVPNAYLVVVGGGAREAELRQLTADLGIADHVHFTGVRRDVGRLMPGFDVTCLSSVHEAAPLTVLESMAAGVPVVATRCGALADMIDVPSQGLLVPVGDSAALASALLALAEDPERRAAMGVAARLRAERDFTIEGTARGYEQLLKELVKR